MSFFIGYKSAYEYWCHHEMANRSATTKALPKREDKPSAKQLECLRFRYPFLSTPIHAVVTNDASKRNSAKLACHSTGTSLQKRSFVALGSDFYVSTPEACFLQIASTHAFTDLLQVGFEFCGSYARCPESKELISLKPRTSKSHLRNYLAGSGSVSGVIRARRALDFICERSESPMETKLVLLLCLPSSHGGYGLPLPHLNFKLFHPQSMRKDRELYRCDLCWPQQKLAIEYDSSQFHQGVHKQFLDSRRRIAIEHFGLHVLSVTKQQIYDALELHKLAQVIARYLGFYLRIRRKDFPSRRANLRKSLLLDY